MRNLQRSAIVIAGFLTALMIAELGARVIEGFLPHPTNWPTAQTELKHNQLDGSKKWDVVFLGSSITEAAVDPEKIAGIRAYNAALPSSTPISNEIWYRREFLPARDRIVVLGVPPWPYHETVEDDLLAAGIEDGLAGPVNSDGGIRLLSYRGVLADWYDLDFRERALESGLWTQFGHQTVYYDRLDDSVAGGLPPYGPPELSDDARIAIQRLSGYVQSHGGRFVLMIEPGRPRSDVPPEIVEDYLTHLQQLADSLGVPLWDTFSMKWGPELYADEVHFNARGTELFTDHVVTLLDELGYR